MFTLMMFIVVALVVGRMAGAAIGITERSHLHRRRHARVQGLSDDRMAPLPPARAETPVEKLQREFARGDMSVDEYERELNRLYGIRG
jgi:hypothetical protein